MRKLCHVTLWVVTLVGCVGCTSKEEEPQYDDKLLQNQLVSQEQYCRQEAEMSANDPTYPTDGFERCLRTMSAMAGANQRAVETGRAERARKEEDIRKLRQAACEIDPGHCD